MSKLKLTKVKLGSHNQALLENILDASFDITESAIALERRVRAINPRLDDRTPSAATFLKDEVKSRITSLRVVRAGLSCGKTAVRTMDFADKPVLKISRFVPIINESGDQVIVDPKDLIYSARITGPNTETTDPRADDTRYLFQYNASEIRYGAFSVPEISVDSSWSDLANRLSVVPPEHRLAMFLGVLPESSVDLSQTG